MLSTSQESTDEEDEPTDEEYRYFQETYGFLAREARENQGTDSGMVRYFHPKRYPVRVDPDGIQIFT